MSMSNAVGVSKYLLGEGGVMEIMQGLTEQCFDPSTGLMVSAIHHIQQLSC
ncbi:hypothetical protein PL8927_600143 [Planktothrix serta PCC 8927]|uniref:Uncharacterized protein n=1 Tax=Planktothrix serta PCC 8927 TaxID=671068 RepID=A0A7Z9BPW0_9CYAN|nr:hypothetical protein PL8927_600143 [Planktothrix serta PCC 8927]